MPLNSGSVAALPEEEGGEYLGIQSSQTTRQKQFILLSFCPHEVIRSSEAVRMGYAEYVLKSTQVILTCSQVRRINTLVGP